jgi:hypothetical protein
MLPPGDVVRVQGCPPGGEAVRGDPRGARLLTEQVIILITFISMGLSRGELRIDISSNCLSWGAGHITTFMYMKKRSFKWTI